MSSFLLMNQIDTNPEFSVIGTSSARLYATILKQIPVHSSGLPSKPTSLSSTPVCRLYIPSCPASSPTSSYPNHCIPHPPRNYRTATAAASPNNRRHLRSSRMQSINGSIDGGVFYNEFLRGEYHCPGRDKRRGGCCWWWYSR